MARIQCSCGRAYTVPDGHLGKQVKCAACNRTFVAEAAEPPKAPAPTTLPLEAASRKAPPAKPPIARAIPRKPPAAKPIPAPRRVRLGELAVARGLLTREALDACLRYMEDVRGLPGQEDLRLGAVLVGKRLLTRAQLDALLREQTHGAAAAAAAAVDLVPRAPRRKPVTDEQREAVRRSVEAAVQKRAEMAVAVGEAAHPGLLDRIRGIHVAIAGGVILFALVTYLLWPDPAAKRVLVAYLKSSDDTAVAPDASLAITDLRLAIREFGDVALLRSARYSYTEELASFGQGEGKDQADDWVELLETVPMSDEKYQALTLLLPALPEELTPRKIGTLEITVQHATCRMVSCPRGMGMYSEGRYRFALLKARSPSWRLDWKVAGLERLAMAAK